MKRKTGILVGLLLAVVLLAGCGGGSGGSEQAPGEETYNLVLANANPVGDVKDLASLKLAELAAEKSDGRINIEVHSGGVLGDWRETIEGLPLGIVDIVIESSGIPCEIAGSELPNALANPITFRDADHWFAVWESDLGREILDTYEEVSGCRIIGPMYRGPRVVTSKKKIEKWDDFKGLKMRIPPTPVFNEIAVRMGCTPTPIPLTDTFTALQQGTVDAQENPIVESYNWGFYEVAPYAILTNHNYEADAFIFDLKKFNSFPEDIQRILEEACEEAAAYRSELTLELEKETYRKWEEAGGEIVAIDRAPMFEAFDTFVEDLYPDLVPINEKVRAVK